MHQLSQTRKLKIAANKAVSTLIILFRTKQMWSERMRSLQLKFKQSIRSAVPVYLFVTLKTVEGICDYNNSRHLFLRKVCFKQNCTKNIQLEAGKYLNPPPPINYVNLYCKSIETLRVFGLDGKT